MIHSNNDTIDPAGTTLTLPVPPSRQPVFTKPAVVMASGDPAWPEVETILRPHLRSGRISLSLWPVAGETEAAMTRELSDALRAVFGMVWNDMVDSALILGNDRVFPAGLGPFLDPGVRNRLLAIPAPVLIAGPARGAPGFGAGDWEGMPTPVHHARAIAATVARYLGVLERPAHDGNGQ